MGDFRVPGCVRGALWGNEFKVQSSRYVCDELGELVDVQNGHYQVYSIIFSAYWPVG
jgi:hypothetical protein